MSFCGRRCSSPKVVKLSRKFIMNNKFDYFCSVNRDNCMDGKSQIQQGLVDAIFAEHLQKVIAFDNLFEGNNKVALQMRDAGVEFRTI